ncbi:immunoglobulin superfamily member 5 [Nematolebias whitei]|uniref:immunoglobulin superfamily member 5 n=1 Tax=Nematolebias whitei TaxID=451745 RepID=UPI0018979597|nr:immunoglobulin superfamily member 5 [Nematolebias whitei]
MDIPLLLALLFSCMFEASGTQMELAPLSLTVVRGDEARFSCSTSSSLWTVMLWLLNGRAVLTISKERGVLPSINPNITAEKCSNSNRHCWVLVLNSTERNNQGQVTCDLQLIDIRTAKLFVQEKGSVQLFGDKRFAFKGDSVLFQCEAAGWYPQPLLQWQVHNKMVSPDEYISTAEVEKRLFTVSSNLSVTAERSSRVDCLASVSALNTPLQSSVSLTVEVFVEDGDDCTVLVGLTSALSALLLLLLLSVCTVLCYRQRRKPISDKATQEVMRFNQSVFGSSSVAEGTGGKVNLGFSRDGPTDVHSSVFITGIDNQKNFETFYKVPDVRSISVSLHSRSQTSEFHEEKIDAIRRITTV